MPSSPDQQPAALSNKDTEERPSWSEKETSLLLGALAGLRAAKKTNSGPGNKRLNPRTVSWDLKNDEPLSPMRSDMSEEEEPLLPPPRSRLARQSFKHAGKLTLQQVLHASPIEAEAETYIQSTLDEIDPTRAGRGPSVAAQESILNAVPNDAKQDFSEDDGGDDDENKSHEDTASSSSFSDMETPFKHPDRVTTTAARLANLANDLKKMQNIKPNAFWGSFSNERNNEPRSQTDTFVSGATTILNRVRKAKGKKKGAVKLAGGGTRTSKWRFICNATNAVCAWSRIKKKTDEEIPDNEGDVEAAEGDTGERDGRIDSAENRKKGLVKSEWEDLEEFFALTRGRYFAVLCKMVLYLVIPGIGVAAILFYAAGNPLCGTKDECADLEAQKRAKPQPVVVDSGSAFNQTDDDTGDSGTLLDPSNNFAEEIASASVSWWILFVFSRQVLTLAGAIFAEMMIVDYFCLRSTLAVKTLGPFMTLFIVQCKGWPFVFFCWAVNDFSFLYGTKFAKHWLYWQDTVKLFNDTNPAGSIISSPSYTRVLVSALVISFGVGLKRFWLSLKLGRSTYSRYAIDLETIMNKILLIGQVATLAREMENLNQRGKVSSGSPSNPPQQHLQDFLSVGTEEERSTAKKTTVQAAVADLKDMDGGDGQFVGCDWTESMQQQVEEALGEWEEPELAHARDENVKISDIIQFRASLSYLNTPFPFSVYFGPADTRQSTIKSTERVYNRLMLNSTNTSVLHFDTLALLAVEPGGKLNKTRLRELVRLFRPDREGNLTLIDFAKSIDSVYKELRLLRASIVNSSKIDLAFERIFNIFFYIIVGCVLLSVVGVDALVLFASVSGFILGFAFMIGSASSKYFEGVLLILLRRPYQVGDRIAVSNVNNDTSSSGSTTWFVKDVTLFATTVVLAATNETATYSNGSLASSRIINAARSPQGVLFFNIKFPIETNYKTLQIFHGCLEKFVAARPREWVKFTAFRATQVAADAGFVEYMVCAQHRQSWQDVGALKQSLANLESFALELSKKMGLQYKSPPLPVDLNMIQQGSSNRAPQSAFNPGDQEGTDNNLSMPALSFPASPGSHQTPGVSVDVASISAMFEK